MQSSYKTIPISLILWFTHSRVRERRERFIVQIQKLWNTSVTCYRVSEGIILHRLLSDETLQSSWFFCPSADLTRTAVNCDDLKNLLSVSRKLSYLFDVKAVSWRFPVWEIWPGVDQKHHHVKKRQWLVCMGTRSFWYRAQRSRWDEHRWEFSGNP